VAPAKRPAQRPYLTVNNTLMGFGRIRGLAPPRDAAAYRRGYLSGMIRGDGYLGVYRYQRKGRKNGDQHRFRLALADSEGLDRTASFLAGFGIGTDRFVFQDAMSARRAMEAIRTSSAAAVAAVTRLIGWPDGDDCDWERGFVAGLFDAEGSYSEGVMRIANTDLQIVHVLQRSLGRLGFDSVIETRRPDSPKPVYSVRVRGGLREHLRFMQTFDPCIGRKRNVEAQAVKSEAQLEIADIEPLDRQFELFDITTGTGDFIANGVVSHNCYARPTHAYLGLSPGLDFETRIFAKTNAAELLRKELAAPGYRVSTISIGANTDPYQPAERELKITRGVIGVLAECQHPFGIVTKNALIERDIDLLAPLAAKNLARAFYSVTTLDNDLARRLEPRASAPERRLAAIQRLTEAGIPVGVMVAPIIPFLTDRYLEETLERAREAGAVMAGYVLLRLPHEVAPLFRDWLAAHYPQKAEHVMSLVQQMRGGRDYDSAFGTRQRGTGEFADLIATRFRLACRRLGLDQERAPLDTTRFRPPRTTPQLDLF
jgi:DNA repair photolyase